MQSDAYASDAPLPSDDRTPAMGDGFKIQPFGSVLVEIVPEEDKECLQTFLRPSTRQMLFNVRRGKAESDYLLMIDCTTRQMDLLSGMGYTPPPEPRAKRKYTRKAKPATEG